jgi:prepilin peptidase CpaA
LAIADFWLAELSDIMNPYLFVCTVACVSVGAIVDIFTRRIPNWLTVPGICLGLGLNMAYAGLEGLVQALLGMSAGFFLLFFVYLLGGMGAGDVKLLSAVGAFVGPTLVFYSFIWMALSGGVLAVFLILHKRAFSQTFANLKSLLFSWLFRNPEPGAAISLQNPSLLKLPYGVAIAIGTVLGLSVRQLPGLGFQDGTIRFFLWGL